MKHNRKIIYLTGFLLAMPLALTSYINSSTLEIYIAKEYLGIIYVIASILAIIGTFKMPDILTRIGNRKTILFLSAIFGASLIFLAVGGNGFIVIPAFIIYFLSTTLIFISLDIFVEDFSKNSPIGGIRGVYLTIINFAWIISQLISGSIIAKSSFQGIYLLSALFTILVCIMFHILLRNFKDPKYEKRPVLKTLKFFLRHKNIFKIYFINLILKFFYAWMVIYTPIYMHEYIGFSWSEIGIIFSFMLLPFVLIELPLGKLSDKIGEKKMLLVGFSIMGLFTALIPLLSIKEFWPWALVLFMTRVGAATVEIMSESYFFKSITEEEDGILSFFRNTYPVAYIIAPLIAVPILLLAPSIAYLFFILGAVMLLGILLTLRLKDVK